MFVMPALGSRDKRILGAHWPANQMNQKTLSQRNKNNIGRHPMSIPDLSICTHGGVHTHTDAHTN